jgi:malate:Na+ symporter
MAILSAAKRQNLMPFAEIATSLGGAIMVIMATLLLRANWPALQGML